MRRLTCRFLWHDVDALTGECHRCRVQVLDPIAEGQR